MSYVTPSHFLKSALIIPVLPFFLKHHFLYFLLLLYNSPLELCNLYYFLFCCLSCTLMFIFFTLIFLLSASDCFLPSPYISQSRWLFLFIAFSFSHYFVLSTPSPYMFSFPITACSAVLESCTLFPSAAMEHPTPCAPGADTPWLAEHPVLYHLRLRGWSPWVEHVPIRLHPPPYWSPPVSQFLMNPRRCALL